MTIVSSDKDLMQLIDDDTLMFDPLKKKESKNPAQKKKTKIKKSGSGGVPWRHRWVAYPSNGLF